MFGRSSHSIGKQIADVGGDIAEGGSATAQRVFSRSPGKLDTYAAGAMVLGMGNWMSMSLFNFDAVKAVAGAKSVPGRAAYGALGLAALYATVRGGKRAGR